MIAAVLVGLATTAGWMNTYGEPYEALVAGLVITVALGLFADASS